MRGRWAAGIVPRNFAWIIRGHLAVSERPGGSAPVHRRVRRHEEILWLRGHGFTKIVSLLPSPHNLHAYDELGVAHEHVPMAIHDDPLPTLVELYPALLRWLYGGERVLIHQDQLDERLAGVLGGFLFWSGLVPELPLAISAIENLLRRQLGSTGRTIAALAVDIAPASDEDRRRPDRPSEAVLTAIAEGRLGPIVEMPRVVPVEEPEDLPAEADPPETATEAAGARSEAPGSRRQDRRPTRPARTGAKKASAPSPKKIAKRASAKASGSQKNAAAATRRRVSGGGTTRAAKSVAKSLDRSAARRKATSVAAKAARTSSSTRRGAKTSTTTGRAAVTKGASVSRRTTSSRRRRAGTG